MALKESKPVGPSAAISAKGSPVNADTKMTGGGGGVSPSKEIEGKTCLPKMGAQMSTSSDDTSNKSVSMPGVGESMKTGAIGK